MTDRIGSGISNIWTAEQERADHERIMKISRNERKAYKKERKDRVKEKEELEEV